VFPEFTPNPPWVCFVPDNSPSSIFSCSPVIFCFFKQLSIFPSFKERVYCRFCYWQIFPSRSFPIICALPYAPSSKSRPIFSSGSFCSPRHDPELLIPGQGLHNLRPPHTPPLLRAPLDTAPFNSLGPSRSVHPVRSVSFSFFVVPCPPPKLGVHLAFLDWLSNFR